MARLTNELVQFTGHFQSLATELSRRLEKQGVGIAEAVSRAVQPENAQVLDDIATAFARTMIFRETGEFAVRIPALSRPTLQYLQFRFGWIKRIERDNSPTKAITLRLGTVLRLDEEHIGGDEYERRCASLAGLFGYQQLQWLVDNQDEHPAFKALLGQIYIDGPGLIVVRADGGRSFPYLHQGGGRWGLHWHWVEDSLHRFGRLASSGK